MKTKIISALVLGLTFSATSFADDAGAAKESYKCKELISQMKHDEAFEYCQRACDADDAFSCSKLGFLHLYGSKAHHDLKQSVKYYRKACDLDDGKSCGFMGFCYELGQYEVKEDIRQAVAYLQKACDLNDGEGCDRLAYLHLKGKGVKKSRTKAYELFQKACDNRNQDGCIKIEERDSRK